MVSAIVDNILYQINQLTISEEVKKLLLIKLEMELGKRYSIDIPYHYKQPNSAQVVKVDA